MKQFTLLSIVAALAAASSAFSASLSPGSSAPALDVKTWYKGAPVTSFDKDKTYVVEFWATWCGPCRESIPHLTELAKKNTDVTFIGVSIWEDDNGKNIADFVKNMGDKMDYHVGYSGNQTGMAQTWMAAAGQNGIPSAFVVKNNKILWIGHPMTLEEPLSQIKAGTFDAAGFQAKFVKDQELAAQREKDQAAINADLSDAIKLHDGGKAADANTKLDATIKQYPQAGAQADSIRFKWLATDDPRAWEAKATALATSKNQQKMLQLCNFAMTEAQPKGGNPALARKAIQIGLTATDNKDVMILYFATQVYQTLKDYATALSNAQTLLKVIPDSQYKNQTALISQVQDQVKDLQAKVKS